MFARSDKPAADPVEGPSLLAAFALWVAQIGLWLVLNEGDASSLIVGAPAALVGTLLWRAIPPTPPAQLSLSGLLRFLPYFLREGFAGGWDVARRALGPQIRLKPGFISYDVALPYGWPRVVFLDVLTLLPGTLSADLDGERVSLHVVDLDATSQAQIAELERRVAQLFGLPEGRR